MDYPKDRISIWIASDHNVDNSVSMIRSWTAGVRDDYHSIHLQIDDKLQGYPGEVSPCQWTKERFTQVIKLRQQALDFARNSWADYFFMIDGDVILENNQTLKMLMAEDKIIIGPKLNSSVEGVYSNFWCGMTEKGYYKRTQDYLPIVTQTSKGCFSVPMVHSAILINLRHAVTRQFSYATPPPDYTGPYDDIIIFASTVRHAGAVMHVLNTDYFGKLPIPLEADYTLDAERDQFDYIKLEAIVFGDPIPTTPHIHVPPIPKDKMDFDQVYMINLLRRPERRKRMMLSLDYLGIEAKVIDAVDGKELTEDYLKDLGIQMMPGFADPYHGRPMTMGEIGCFLSHYNIWKEMVIKNYEKVIVFEDDLRFEPYFRQKMRLLMMEVEEHVPKWELIYLGRKRLARDDEVYVAGTKSLVWPSYSYWTLSYILHLRGARKLLAQDPLSKMIPVDEYLPIMFDKHPEESWKENFAPRNLVGLSAEPLLIHPTHYTGEINYISDTEDSSVIGPTLKSQGHATDEL